jgi:hypothetical protein
LKFEKAINRKQAQMPKKTKAIPDDRAEWTFGEALYWHFFMFGTRPDGSPTARTGKVWDPKLAADAAGVSVRGFWYWVDDRHLPYDTKNIERALFGESTEFDEARNELRRLLREGRAAMAKASATSDTTADPSATSDKIPAILTGQAVRVYETPFDAAEVDGPVTEDDFRAVMPFAAENSGKSRKNPSQDGPSAREEPIRGRVVSTSILQSGASTPRSRKTVAVICAGVLLLLGVLSTTNPLPPARPRQKTTRPLSAKPERHPIRPPTPFQRPGQSRRPSKSAGRLRNKSGRTTNGPSRRKRPWTSLSKRV